MITVTSRYTFSAAHVLSRTDCSDEENERIYGKCANTNGHGHNYGMEVTVGGEIDPRTGEIISRDALDRLVSEQVLERFAHRRLNDDPLFASEVPTAENIAKAIYRLLEEPIADGDGVHLVGVRLVETARNFAEVGEER